MNEHIKKIYINVLKHNRFIHFAGIVDGFYMVAVYDNSPHQARFKDIIALG